MITDLTKDIEYKADCYLYWIRKASHTDISTEGYVGISSVPKSRIKQHNSCLSNPEKRNKQGYSQKFIEAFQEEELFFSIVNCGTMSEIQNQEYLLRPTEMVGWNVAVGGLINGVCSRYKHGGNRNQTLYNKFSKFVDDCKSSGVYIDRNFLTDSGFKLFCLHIEDRCNGMNVKSKTIGLVDEKLGFVCGNFYIEPASKNSDHSKWVFFNDRWWSKVEACLENGVDVSTADKRLTKYNRTREEAVGFVPLIPSCYEIVYLDGVPCKHNRKLSKHSKEDLVKIYEFYKQEKSGFKDYCKSFGAEDSNMLRYFKRYGLTTSVDRRTKDFRSGSD